MIPATISLVRNQEISSGEPRDGIVFLTANVRPTGLRVTARLADARGEEGPANPQHVPFIHQPRTTSSIQCTFMRRILDVNC